MAVEVVIKCVNCARAHNTKSPFVCDCGGLLDVSFNVNETNATKKLFDKRLHEKKFPNSSGVWRFREIVHPLARDKDIVSRPEGNTNSYCHEKLSEFTGVKKLFAKHEGENPSGSFKDRGITVGITEANRLKAKTVACASTGNTSASLASYAAISGKKSVVFVPQGNIAVGKLAQALAFNATVLQVKGNFDQAMRMVQESATNLGMYLLNSINPWRLEGQKTIVFDLIQQLEWNAPDWIIVPAGNLGNTSAFGKALMELKELDCIDKVPRVAAVQAEGANPFYALWKNKSNKLKAVKDPKTIASAIRIGKPVNWQKALRTMKCTNGVVEQVSDQEIMDAKAVVDACGIGCEPASAASIAGAKKLHETGVIKEDETIACILTGNLLKDPDATVNYHLGKLKDLLPSFANPPKTIEPDLKEVEKALEE